MTHANLHAVSHLIGGSDPALFGAPAGFYTGSYYGPHIGLTTTGQITNGELRVVPLLVAATLAIDRIGVRVNAGGSAGAIARLGIYNDDGTFQPGTVLVDAGTVSTTSGGWKEITISQTLTRGVWWLACVPQGAPTTLATFNVFTGGFCVGAFTMPNDCQFICNAYINSGIISTLTTWPGPTPPLTTAGFRMGVRAA